MRSQDKSTEAHTVARVGTGLRSRADVSPAQIQLGFDVATAMHRSVTATVKYFGKVLTLP